MNKDIPYIALMNKLYGIYCENIQEKLWTNIEISLY